MQPEHHLLHALYPHLSPEELTQVGENLDHYLQSTLRLYEAICADPKRYAKLRALTAPPVASSMVDGDISDTTHTQPS